MTAKAYPKRFDVSHLKSAKFSRRGLRGYFEYRDLGIQRATRGKVVAHVIRARPGRRRMANGTGTTSTCSSSTC
jgi:hypothetical protein